MLNKHRINMKTLQSRKI